MRSAQAKFCLLLLVGALANSAYATEIGKSSSSVGQDVVIDKPAAAPAKFTAQILRGLGRKAAPGTGPTDRAIDDPTLLPDCIPANGVVCSDRDYTGLLDVNPAVPDLALDTQYVFAGFEPSLEVSTGDETKVGLVDGSFSSDVKGNVKGEVKATAGDEVVTASSETTPLLFGTKLSTRPDLLLPTKLAFTLGKTDAENSLEWRTNKPNFFYVLGQNLGFPIGLATVTDEVAGK